MKDLLFDVGNTRLKWGVADDGEIRRTGHIAQDKLRETGLAALTTRLPSRVDRVMVSNVAGPTFATRLAGVIGAHCRRDVHFARTSRSALGVTNGYSQPRRMGVDRWVAILAAWREFESACLVVDVGTAVTLDAIGDDGQHLGGQILPGVRLMGETLASGTSDIPRTRSRAPDAFDDLQMFARNTGDAVGAGSLNAVTGAIERAIRTLRSSAYDVSVVLTGGDASRILHALNEPALHRPNLVLQGLLEMLEAE